ncbi:nicotinate (nicotinamide) nucleotide adenylyltransferase [Reinekea marinisedimentorum]|uniref:Probable nicotinate-nucleotide adenylyltransferase n=1 Tax=Reinekea marinisedimentorum TaxID=230495 RepID=A0A4R3I8N0_9GAMM|nr:nicotinate (nicotinamide) nucleotide adenylyltransferase [Reinekea marinisedimentorum]TCS41682.1 nicotinate-nucleotide adenylyltransferase [Reinekea marinisedimentorum]
MSHKPHSNNGNIVAIYGGTFDPFHKAHAAICSSVLSHSEISQLRVIPCYLPALKAEASASAEHRLAMLERWRSAQSGAGRIYIDDQEITRKGASYSVDTVRQIAEANPGAKLLFVLGTDAWNSLPRWHQYQELAAKVSFWVFHRNGEAAAIPHSGLQPRDSLHQLLTGGNGGYWLDASVDLPVSSTDLRKHLQHELNLPDEIAGYINENQLYRKAQST